MKGINGTLWSLFTLLTFASSLALVLIYALRAQPNDQPDKKISPLPIPAKGGPCPSADELLVDQYIKRWDDKVASHLRSSPDVLRTEDASWNTLTRDLHMYTAYLHRQGNSHVRIGSLISFNSTRAKELPPLSCSYKNAQGGQGTVPAYVQLLWDWITPNTKFRAAQIICPLPAGWTTGVVKGDILVSVREVYKNDTPKFWINVTQTPTFSKVNCCAVCVKPVYKPLGSLIKVAEFIAHYRVIGARHFFFYDLSMPEYLKALLARFQSAGIDVTVVQFKLPVNDSLVPNFGQITALHDCIWRSMAKAEWFVHVDFDELIVPLRFPSLPAVVNYTEKRAVRPRVGSVMFLSRTYCREYGASKWSMDKGELPLLTRLYPFFAHAGSRLFTPKYMARARSVKVAAVHTVLRYTDGAVEKVLLERQGAINHYRRCCGWWDREFLKNYGVDLWNTSALLRENATLAFTELAEKDLALTTLKDIVKQDVPT